MSKQQDKGSARPVEDRRELRTKATPEQVWKAWADPAHITGWFADRASGRAEPGGAIVHAFDKFGFEMRLEVVEVVPGETLTLRGMGPTGTPLLQKISIRREGGETVLELVHSGFDAGADLTDEYKGMDSGWKLALAILGHYLEHHYGKRRQPYLEMRPASFTWEAIRPWFREGHALARWLVEGGAIGAVGSPVRLTLATPGGGLPQTLTGRVLADSGDEVALSWDEIDGALELKAFPMGPSRAVCLRAMSWSATPPDVGEMERSFQTALERLTAQL